MEWFKDDLAALNAEIKAGTPLARLLVVLHNPTAEAAVAELLKPYVKGVSVAEKKSGGIGSLFGWFKK